MSSAGILNLPITLLPVDNFHDRALWCKSTGRNYNMHGWILCRYCATGWFWWISGLRAVTALRASQKPSAPLCYSLQSSHNNPVCTVTVHNQVSLCCHSCIIQIITRLKMCLATAPGSGIWLARWDHKLVSLTHLPPGQNGRHFPDDIFNLHHF